MIERLGPDVRRPDVAGYLVEARTRLDRARYLSETEAAHREFAHRIGLDCDERRHVMKPVLLATDGSPTAEKATATAIILLGCLEPKSSSSASGTLRTPDTAQWDSRRSR